MSRFPVAGDIRIILGKGLKTRTKEDIMNRKNWSDYPELKKLFDKILEHRRNCPHWETDTPCHNCHFNTLTKIEKELGLRV